MSIVSNDTRFAPPMATMPDTPYGSLSDSYHTPSARWGECCVNAGRMGGQWGAIVASIGTHCPIGVPTCGSAHRIALNGSRSVAVWGANGGEPPARRLNGGPMGPKPRHCAPIGPGTATQVVVGHARPPGGLTD